MLDVYLSYSYLLKQIDQWLLRGGNGFETLAEGMQQSVKVLPVGVR